MKSKADSKPVSTARPILREDQIRFYQNNLMVTTAALIDRLMPKRIKGDRELAERREATERFRKQLIKNCAA